MEFTERCHVLSTRVMESLLCSAGASCTPVQMSSARIAVFSKVWFSVLSDNQTPYH